MSGIVMMNVAKMVVVDLWSKTATKVDTCLEDFKINTYIFPFLEGRGRGEGLRDLIQIKGPRVLDFFFAYPLQK